jgi:hypothetical protein
VIDSVAAFFDNPPHCCSISRAISAAQDWALLTLHEPEDQEIYIGREVVVSLCCRDFQ